MSKETESGEFVSLTSVRIKKLAEKLKEMSKEIYIMHKGNIGQMKYIVRNDPAMLSWLIEHEDIHLEMEKTAEGIMNVANRIQKAEMELAQERLLKESQSEE